jgi:hypothetical protein
MATLHIMTDAEKQLKADCEKFGLDYGRAVGTIMSGLKLHCGKEVVWTKVQDDQYVRTVWYNALCNYRSDRYSKHGNAVYDRVTTIG